MLKQIKEFLQGCPQLQGMTLSADFLGEEPGAVSVQGLSCAPVLYRYTDGGSLRQFMFSISLRAPFYPSTEVSPEGFFDAVEARLLSGVPQLSLGQTAQRFEVLKSSALQDRDYASVRYEMVCRLIYFEGGE